MIMPRQAQLPLPIFTEGKTYYAYYCAISSSIYQYNYFKCMVRTYHMHHCYSDGKFVLSTCGRDAQATRS